MADTIHITSITIKQEIYSDLIHVSSITIKQELTDLNSPTNLEIDYTINRLSWDSEYDDKDYNVYRNTSSASFYGAELVSTTSNKYYDIVDDIDSYFWVSATTGVGSESVESEMATFISTIYAPTNLTNEQNMLKWDASLSSNVIGYNIYRSLVSDFNTAELIGTTTDTQFEVDRRNAYFWVTAVK